MFQTILSPSSPLQQIIAISRILLGMQRLSNKCDISYCRNCHQPTMNAVRTIHESYCAINTLPCTQCSNSISVCRHCQLSMPPCQFQSHLSICIKEAGSRSREGKRQSERVIGSRKRLNIFETVCPYCKKQSNVNEILKHIDMCAVRKESKVLSENVQKVGKIVRSRNVNPDSSLEKVARIDSQQLLSEKVHTHFGIKRNTKEPKYPQTQQVIPIQEQQNRQITSNRSIGENKIGEKGRRQKSIYQIRLMTPVPVFLIKSNDGHDALNGIESVGVGRENIGKLTKNY